MSEEEKNEFAYKRDNGEDIIDPVAIRSCKDEQNRDIIENQRLGSYDKYGNYILIPEIRQELINIPKLVYNTREEENCKIFDLSAKIPLFENLYFKLKISNIEAVLYITETITREAGEYVEVYEEVVDSLSLQEEKIPQSIIFRTFNIFENDDDYGQEFEDFYGFENITDNNGNIRNTVDSNKMNTLKRTPASISFVPSVAGLILAGEVIKDLISFH